MPPLPVFSRHRTVAKERQDDETDGHHGLRSSYAVPLFSAKTMLIVVTCLAYLAASSLLILLNKYLLSTDGFKFPLMLSGSGMLLSATGATLLLRFGWPVPVKDQKAVSAGAYLTRVLPLGFCSAATLALGNVAYLYLDVGLLQMLKSCCPVFVLLVATLFGLERFSLPLAASVALIAGGTATTAATGVSAVSAIGLSVQLASELCEAFRLCLAQLLMTRMALHPFEALKHMGGASVAFLGVGVALLEWPEFVAQRAWRRVLAHPHWYAAAATMGFALNVLAFAVIRLTSSLTQKVLGTAKNVGLVVFSVLFLAEQVTTRQWIGYQVSLLGFAWYQRIKMAPKPASSPGGGNGKSTQ